MIFSVLFPGKRIESMNEKSTSATKTSAKTINRSQAVIKKYINFPTNKKIKETPNSIDMMLAELVPITIPARPHRQ